MRPPVLRISTGLRGWEAGRKCISTLGWTVHVAQRGQRILKEHVPLKPRKGRDATQRVYLEPWQGDFPEAVRRKIHFCERLTGHNIAVLQIKLHWPHLGLCGSACDGIPFTYCVLVTGGKCVFREGGVVKEKHEKREYLEYL